MAVHIEAVKIIYLIIVMVIQPNEENILIIKVVDIHQAIHIINPEVGPLVLEVAGTYSIKVITLATNFVNLAYKIVVQAVKVVIQVGKIDTHCINVVNQVEKIFVQ